MRAHASTSLHIECLQQSTAAGELATIRLLVSGDGKRLLVFFLDCH
jgi:hypothetical protein